MNTFTYVVLSVTAVSLLSLIGIFTLSFNETKLKKMLLYLVSFAVGGLYGDAFIHLIPESIRQLGPGISTSVYILSGIFLFFIIEKFIRWNQQLVESPEPKVLPLVPLTLLVDSVHNFIDGMLIGASYLISIPIGLATTLAVVFHEIPHEIGDFALLVHGGLSVRKAILFNFLTALFAIAGGVVSLLIGNNIEGYSKIVIPLTAGGFIYIAGSDLIPELQLSVRPKTTIIQLAMISSGVGIMALLLVFAR
jgi:zinc and cadmium transporter